MKTTYWAVEGNQGYDIILWGDDSPGHYHHYEGPFLSLREARKAVCRWIEIDRAGLSDELARINQIKAKGLRRKGGRK